MLSLLLVVSLSIANANEPPIAGKMLFATQPFSAGGASGTKNSFSSAEYIYGRLELNGATIREAFKIDETNGLPASIMCDVSLVQNDYVVGSGDRYYILLSDADKASSSLNFDVFPEPKNARTLYSMLDDFSAGYGFVPLYGVIFNSKPEAGNYKVRVKLYNRTKDGWGKELDSDKWPSIEQEFDFTFRDEDISRVMKNKDVIRDVLRENAFRYESLPAIFAKSAVITDPKATNAKVMAILKRDLGQRTILKMAIEKNGGTLWSIAKDDYGLPKYRYFTPTVYVAYKMDGKCYVGTVTLRENYSGGGTYGPLEVGFTSASEMQDRGIDCDKVK